MDLKYKIAFGTLLVITAIRFSCMNYGIPGIYKINEQGQKEFYNDGLLNYYKNPMEDNETRELNPRSNNKTLQNLLES